MIKDNSSQASSGQAMPPGSLICIGPPGQQICIPIGSTGPTIPIDPVCAGLLHGSLLRRALARFRAANSNRHQFYRNEIDGLRADGLVTDAEVRVLHGIWEAVRNLDDGEREAAGRIREAYQRMIDDQASPVAIVIAGIAADSSSTQGAAKGTATADVAGGIGGAAAGAGVGGAAGGVGALPGAVIGGLIGGLGASLAWEIDQD